jgi:cobalt-zinc-cadmium efflux system outer membrane protein
LLSGLAGALLASTSSHSQSLRDAFESAWSRQPAAQATGAREDELAARRDAATALFPEPPSVNLGYRTDRLNQDAGARELEGIVSLPIWTPGTRDAAQAVARAELEQFGSGLRTQRWRLAGEVREAYWQARLAATELDLARRKLVMFPILVTMYVLLAKREEHDVEAEFGDVYRRYAATTPAFLPRWGDATPARHGNG